MHYPVITRKRDLFSYYTPWKGAGHETSSFFIKEEMYESDLSIQCDPVYTLGIIFWGSSFCNNVSVEQRGSFRNGRIPAGIGRALFLSVTASSGISGRPRRKICPDKNAADHVCSVQCVCILLQLLPGISIMLMAVLYMVSIWSSDAMVSLLNAISVAYNNAGYFVDYGAARGIGAVASAVSSLIIGWVIAKFGTTWMLVLLLAARLGSMIALAGFPEIQQSRSAVSADHRSLSIGAFFGQYRWYCLSLLGIAFLGMYHAMTENYMIVIMNALGGNSSHVGVALFIAAMVAAPVIFFFEKIRKVFRDTTVLKIAAVSFFIKAVGFYFAGNIQTIYLLQFFQISSYALLAPAQVYYAKEKVRDNDMVKGQAFITAAYALGCAAGNFAGGQLLSQGAGAILLAGICMAAAGTAIVFATVTKSDFCL